MRHGVGIGEVDGLLALLGDGHGADDAVCLVGLQRWDEAVPGRVLDYEVVAITIREVPHEVHGQAGGLPRIVLGLERRVGKLHRHREDGLAILRLRAAVLRPAAHEADRPKR